MAKSFSVPTLQAANYLYSQSGSKTNWLFKLSDNRLGRLLKEIGVIPYERRSGKVYYNDRDIEAVAIAVKHNKLFGQPFIKMF